MTPMDTPTPQQAACLQSMFDHFNGELFNGTLDRHSVILCWTHAHQIKAGYYYPNRWTDDGGNALAELSINARCMRERTVTELSSYMVHEMIHMEQHTAGTTGRPGYHNAGFIERAQRLGFKAVNERGEEVGVGQGAHACDLHPAEGGAFLRALASLPEEAIPAYEAEGGVPAEESEEGREQRQEDGGTPPSVPPKPRAKGGKRSKYVCPVCGQAAWSKPGANLLCGNEECGAARMEEYI